MLKSASTACSKAIKKGKTYKLFDLVLDVFHVAECNEEVQDWVQKPEHIVNVVKILDEFLVVLPETDTVDVKRMVCREVKYKSDVWDCAPEDKPLRRLLVSD